MEPVTWVTTMNHTRPLRNPLCSTVLLAVLLALTGAAAGDEIRLSALDLGAASQGYGNPAANKTVDGHPLVLGGRTFDHGFGTHADSRLVLDLKGSARRFTAWVGVDDETKAGLRDHGWTYINIDDFWMPKNEDKDPTLHGELKHRSPKNPTT